MKKVGIKFNGSKGEIVTIDLGHDGLGRKCFILNSDAFSYKDCVSPWDNMNLRLLFSCGNKKLLCQYAEKRWEFICVSVSITYGI